MRTLDFNKKQIKTIMLMGCGCILFYLCLREMPAVLSAAQGLLKLLSPFLLGAAVAFIINVPMRRIETFLFRKSERFQRLRRPVSFLVTVALAVAVITVILYIVIPQLAESLHILASQLPVAFAGVQAWLQDKVQVWEALEQLTSQLTVDWETIIHKAVAFLEDAAGLLVNGGIGMITDLINGLVNLVIGLIFAIYLLMAKETLTRQGKQVLYALCSTRVAEKILHVCAYSNRVFSRFISGQCLEACILGLMFFVTMTILRLPYAMLVAVVIAFTALIPMVGAFIGCLVGLLLIVLVDPWKALVFLITFLILQQVEGNLIYPHVVGNSVGLPSIWVLVAITLGGNLMGVAGMIVFIPLCSVLYALFRLYVRDRLRRKGIPAQKWNQPVVLDEQVLLRRKETPPED